MLGRHVLASKERIEGGVTASSHGLYFLGPTYCDSYDLPNTVRIFRSPETSCEQIR